MKSAHVIPLSRYLKALPFPPFDGTSGALFDPRGADSRRRGARTFYPMPGKGRSHQDLFETPG